jgi:hypothetical protein
MSLQNISINIEKIIKNNKISKEYKIIKEMEDKITEIYQNNDDTDILSENKMGLLYEIKDDFCNVIIHKKIDFALNEILDENILKIKDKLVFTGSMIRSILIDKEEYRKELFISACDIVSWKNIILDIETYEETETMYYKKNKDYVINLFKYPFSSPSEIILNGPYLKRFGLFQDRIYASPMFIMEYNLKLKYMNLNYLDPVFKTELDIFDLLHPIPEHKNDIYDIINKKDYRALTHITTYDLNKIRDNLTCIEYALQLYIKEECSIIQGQLKLMILELLKHVQFKRNPGFYAELIKLDKYDTELYEILLTPDYKKLRQSIEAFSSLEELNISILNYYIKNDFQDDFYSYIKMIYKKPASVIYNTIGEYNPKKIIQEGIKKKYFSDYNIYKIILLSQQLNYINLIKFDINIAMNFLDKIVKKCLIKSFYYLFKIDSTIINTVDSNNSTILHQIEMSEKPSNVEDMIRLLITLDESILFKKNNDGQTPLLYLAEKDTDILEILIKIIKEKNLHKLFDDKDNDGNNIIHILSKSNINNKLIKMIIYDSMHLLNEKNNNEETPLIVSCINVAEDVFYLLKSIGAELLLVDKFGNSCEHYICLNEMCIGMAIHNKQNIFGYEPKDYCKVSHDYYYFIN